jgi:hypothetical protein
MPSCDDIGIAVRQWGDEWGDFHLRARGVGGPQPAGQRAPPKTRKGKERVEVPVQPGLAPEIPDVERSQRRLRSQRHEPGWRDDG